jgi:hypothetical protein
MSEWTELSALWQSSAEPIDLTPLRKIAVSYRRRLVALLVGEIVVALGVAWLSVLVTRDGVEPWELVWVITLWGFTAIAVVFAWWNRRGTWSSLGESVDAYVHITRLRAQRQMQSAYFAAVFFAAEVVVIVAQLFWFGRLTSLAFLVIAAMGIVIAAWCWSIRARVVRELAAVDEYQAGVAIIK